MGESELLLDLAIAFGAALGGGLIARLLKLPAILGYILAGVVISPHALGLVQNTNDIRTLATIGVVLLLFTLGVESSLHELKRIRDVAIFGGITQLVIIIGLGIIVVMFLFGQGIREASIFAFLISLSSTKVVVGMLVERGEANSVHGNVMIGILLVQNIAATFAMFILPALGTGGALLPVLGMAVLKAVVFIALVLGVGLWLIPHILKRVVLRQSRELFIISVAALCMGGAFSAYYLGVSAALGAFAVGLMVSESDFAHQALGDIVPLRDLFAALFFVSIGMLINLPFLVSNINSLLILIAVIVLVKFAINSGITRVFGYRGKTVPLVGAGMVQVGEFSFVLAELCLGVGVIGQYTYFMILDSAVLTIIITPFIFIVTSKLYAKWRGSIQVASGDIDQLSMRIAGVPNHVVLCGYGRVGKNVASLLECFNVPYTVADLDPKTISELREKEVPCIYGDAGNSRVLCEAGIRSAAVLAIAIADPMSARLAIDYARRVNPNLDIIARAHNNSELKFLRGRNVSEIVRPETEAGIEIARHILCRLGMPVIEVEKVVASQRKAYPGL